MQKKNTFYLVNFTKKKKEADLKTIIFMCGD